MGSLCNRVLQTQQVAERKLQNQPSEYYKGKVPSEYQGNPQTIRNDSKYIVYESENNMNQNTLTLSKYFYRSETWQEENTGEDAELDDYSKNFLVEMFKYQKSILKLQATFDKHIEHTKIKLLIDYFKLPYIRLLLCYLFENVDKIQTFQTSQIIDLMKQQIGLAMIQCIKQFKINLLHQILVENYRQESVLIGLTKYASKKGSELDKWHRFFEWIQFIFS